MPRKSHRRRKHKTPHLTGQIHGYVVVNRIDYSIRDPISPGKLRAWAEWIPKDKEVLV